MKYAIGIVGLVLGLLAILLLAPYLKPFTEGFSDTPAEAVKEASDTQGEEVKAIGSELVALNKLLENPTLEESTRERVLKQKEELQDKIAKMTTVALPSVEIQPSKEGFQPFVPSELESFETFR